MSRNFDKPLSRHFGERRATREAERQVDVGDQVRQDVVDALARRRRPGRKQNGRPSRTHLAPSAMALKTSAPRRMPLSNRTVVPVADGVARPGAGRRARRWRRRADGRRGWRRSRPRHRGRPPSARRPGASSPLSRIGSRVDLRSRARSSQVREGSEKISRKYSMARAGFAGGSPPIALWNTGSLK